MNPESLACTCPPKRCNRAKARGAWQAIRTKIKEKGARENFLVRYTACFVTM